MQQLSNKAGLVTADEPWSTILTSQDPFTCTVCRTRGVGRHRETIEYKQNGGPLGSTVGSSSSTPIFPPAKYQPDDKSQQHISNPLNMSKQQDFPIIFNIGGSSRHEVIFINSSHTIDDISKKAEDLAFSSVNCEEPLAKYKKKGDAEKVTSIKVRWSAEGRDSRIFPKSTTLTEENTEAILTLIGLNGGKDVLEIDMAAPQPEKDASKE